jgi:hypothetical protein
MIGKGMSSGVNLLARSCLKFKMVTSEWGYKDFQKEPEGEVNRELVVGRIK